MSLRAYQRLLGAVNKPPNASGNKNKKVKKPVNKSVKIESSDSLEVEDSTKLISSSTSNDKIQDIGAAESQTEQLDPEPTENISDNIEKTTDAQNNETSNMAEEKDADVTITSEDGITCVLLNDEDNNSKSTSSNEKVEEYHKEQPKTGASTSYSRLLLNDECNSYKSKSSYRKVDEHHREQPKTSASTSYSRSSGAHKEKERLTYSPDIDHLDQSRSDYFCKVCDRHMNSWDTWMSHVSGKKHLKNIKKNPYDEALSQKYMKLSSKNAILNDLLTDIRDPIVGLDFMCETQNVNQPPTFFCYLCHDSLNTSTVINHLLNVKHHLAYLKHVDPSEHSIINAMNLSKTALANLVANKTCEWEETQGRGLIEVKKQIVKIKAPFSPRETFTGNEYTEHNSIYTISSSDSEDEHRKNFRKNDYSHHSTSKRIKSSFGSTDYRKSFHPSQSATNKRPSDYHYRSSANDLVLENIRNISNSTKIKVLPYVSNVNIASEADLKEVMEAVNILSQSLLYYKFSKYSIDMQKKVAWEILQQPDPSNSSCPVNSNPNLSNILESGFNFRSTNTCDSKQKEELYTCELPPMSGIPTWSK